jgi:hypothetical protein
MAAGFSLVCDLLSYDMRPNESERRSTEILQMEASVRLRLPLLAANCKTADRRGFADALRRVSALDREPKSDEFFCHQDTPLPWFARERMTNRTRYAVDVTGGGLSSAISRRMWAIRFLGMATSTIWNAT